MRAMPNKWWETSKLWLLLWSMIHNGSHQKYVMYCSSLYADLNYCSLLFALKCDWLGDINSIAFACYSLYIGVKLVACLAILRVCNTVDVGAMVL